MNQDEKKITAASYIYQFYSEIQNLNHEYSNYLNIMLELENKYSSNVEKNASDEEKNFIKIQIQKVRYSTHQTYIHYLSITKGLNKNPDNKIVKSYDLIKKQFMINREELEKYVTNINAVLVLEVIKNLLESSQDLIQEIYKNANT